MFKNVKNEILRWPIQREKRLLSTNQSGQNNHETRSEKTFSTFY